MRLIYKIIVVLIILIMLSNVYVFAEDETITVKAKVIGTGEVYDEEVGNVSSKYQDVEVKIIEGEYKDKVFKSKYMLSMSFDSNAFAYELKDGDIVQVGITKKGDEINVVIQTLVRYNYVILMIIAFFGIVILVGGIKGLKAIVALVATILAIWFITINCIYKGYSPILMSVITSVVVIFLTFVIIGGFKKKTVTAALGTAGGVLLAGVMAIIFGNLAKLSGWTEEAAFLSMSTGTVVFNFRELLFAGIVIAALGACMDVGMSIASALDELKEKDPDITWKDLFKSGMNIGRDVIGTMTNTLILAYVGSSLTLILVFVALNFSIETIVNKEVIAMDIISAVAGSMGVIFTIPVTAVVYALFNKNKTTYKKTPETKIDGKRTLKI